MNTDQPRHGTSFWKSRSGTALCGFLAIAAVLLIVEHRAHALQWLPFALLLACPLLHLFHGHGGHAGHGGRAGERGDNTGRQPDSDADRRA